MSNLNKEKEYSNMSDALRFVFDQLLKNIFISVPGIIESYDPETKRCQVRPAINVRKTDNNTSQPSSIVNVPVVWPSGGGFTIISPLPAGTPVEIRFSQRGITAFKETYGQSDPGNGLFAKEDACVIPSFGALEITPATTDGMAIQAEDGENYLFVENGTVKIKSTENIIIDADSKVEINAPEVEVNSTTADINAATKATIASPIVEIASPVIIMGGVGGSGTVNADLTINGKLTVNE